MASLYKRASASQALILRIVEGACKNVCDIHPELEIPPKFRRSIAKRAAGTISAQWSELLARGRQPVSARALLRVVMRRVRRSQISMAASGERIPMTPFPAQRLIKEISRPLKELRAAGEFEKVEAYITVLKKIDELKLDALQQNSRLR